MITEWTDQAVQRDAFLAAEALAQAKPSNATELVVTDQAGPVDQDTEFPAANMQTAETNQPEGKEFVIVSKQIKGSKTEEGMLSKDGSVFSGDKHSKNNVLKEDAPDKGANGPSREKLSKGNSVSNVERLNKDNVPDKGGNVFRKERPNKGSSVSNEGEPGKGNNEFSAVDPVKGSAFKGLIQEEPHIMPADPGQEVTSEAAVN